MTVNPQTGASGPFSVVKQALAAAQEAPAASPPAQAPADGQPAVAGDGSSVDGATLMHGTAGVVGQEDLAARSVDQAGLAAMMKGLEPPPAEEPAEPSGGGLLGTITSGLGNLLDKGRDAVAGVTEAVSDTVAEVGDALGAIGDESGGNLVSRVVSGVGNALGKTVEGAGNVLAEVNEGVADLAGDVAEAGANTVAAGLDEVGLGGVAGVVRGAGRVVDQYGDAAADHNRSLLRGVGAALGDNISGIGQVVAHPVETVQGLAHLVSHPGEVVEVGKAIWNEATEEGLTYGVGYVAGNVLPALLTGGGSLAGGAGARVGAAAGRVAGRLLKGAQAGEAAETLAGGVAAVARVADKAGFDAAADALRAADGAIGEVSGTVARVADDVAAEAARLADLPLNRLLDEAGTLGTRLLDEAEAIKALVGKPGVQPADFENLFLRGREASQTVLTELRRRSEGLPESAQTLALREALAAQVKEISQAERALRKAYNTGWDTQVPPGIGTQPGTLPVGRRLEALLERANPTESALEIQNRAVQVLRSGSTVPVEAVVRPGEILVKAVPRGAGAPTSTSIYWSSPQELLDAASRLNPRALANHLALPPSSVAGIEGFDFYLIRATDEVPVFESTIAPTRHELTGLRQAGGGRQVIVPDRGAFGPPEPVTLDQLRALLTPAA